MKRIPFFCAITSLALLIAACTESEDSSVSSRSELPLNAVPSPSYEVVEKHLDLGGQLYLYYDTETVMVRLDQMLADLPSLFRSLPDLGGTATDMPMQMLLSADWQTTFRDLGFTRIKALGMSSVKLENGTYRNVARLYVEPAEEEGVFGLIADSDAFSSLAYAPDTTDFFHTLSLEPGKIVNVIRTAAESLAGSQGKSMIDAWLNAPAGASSLTIEQIVRAAPKRISLIVDLDRSQSSQLPGVPIEFPRASTLLVLEGQGDDFQNLLGILLSEGSTVSEEGNFTYYRSPQDMSHPGLSWLAPLAVMDTGEPRMFFATDNSIFEQSIADENRLADSEGYLASMEGLPPTGASLTYLSPDFTQWVADLREDLTRNFPPVRIAFTFYAMYLPILSIEPMDSASISISGRDADGLFVVANWPYSARPQMAFGANQSVVTTGLLAAMAIPAFQKVRENSQEKTIINNLRMIASGGQQYLLEEGVNSVRYEELVGDYFAPISPVAGEDYSGLVVEPSGILEVTTASGKSVTYTY